MRVDIIVPDFDESSNEVMLSSWYKKVGDRISKNEIIADAETPSVACGITSSYDCILAKILVKEGESISQGTKIAVIETDLNADLSDIKLQQTVEEAKKESKAIDSQIQEDKQKQDRERMEQASADSSKGYSLSVPTGAEVEGDTHELRVSDKVIDDALVADRITEHTEERFRSILKEAENKAKEEAQKLREKILEDAQKQVQTQVEELKAKILKEYGEKATKDASEMHQKIIQGSLLEAESTKVKLIDEAREKAEEEAKEIREEILKNAKTKSKEEAETIVKEAVSRAKEKAQAEAELLSKEIIEKSIEESKLEAKAIKKDIIHSAQKHAIKKSENIVKNIMNQAKQHSHLQTEEILVTNELIMRETEHFQKEMLESMHGEIMDTMNLTLESIAKEIRRLIKFSVAEIVKEVKAEVHAQIDQIKKSTEKVFRDIRDPVKSTMSEDFSEGPERLERRTAAYSYMDEGSIGGSTQKIPDRERLFGSFNEEEIGEKKETFIGRATEQENKLDRRQTEIVRKLLQPEWGSSPEMYADNWSKPQYFASPNDYKEPLDPLKRRIFKKMKDSYDTSVISTVSHEVDMSAILALEKFFGKAFSEKHNIRLGFTPFFISACICALRQYRVFNAHIRGNEIIYKNNFDISIITSGNDGIAAPVIRHADLLSIAEIEKSMISLSKRAAEGALSIEEVSGGTFTVVNAGIYGSIMGTDLLTPPQVATLSVHKMYDRPVATDKGIEVKPMLYISLSYDHRISDTKKASEFLAKIKDYVENPGWQILGL